LETQDSPENWRELGSQVTPSHHRVRLNSNRHATRGRISQYGAAIFFGVLSSPATTEYGRPDILYLGSVRIDLPFGRGYLMVPPWYEGLAVVFESAIVRIPKLEEARRLRDGYRRSRQRSVRG